MNLRSIDPQPPCPLALDGVKRALDRVPYDRTKQYEKYFDTILPASDADRFRRGLFALASVHTGWVANCVLYEMLWDFDAWLHDDQKLMELLVDSRAGMFRNRHKFFRHFADQYWQNPGAYRPRPDEDWFDFRGRIQRTVLGLGPAKAAFFCELTAFQETDVVCFDTHILQLYGLPASPNTKAFKWSEVHWMQECRERGMSPCSARWCYWDQKQRKSDSRYWSKVLEGDPRGMFVGRQLMLFDMDSLKQ